MRRHATLMLTGLALVVLSAATMAQDAPRERRQAIVLVASRALADPNFIRSVVLVMFPPDAGPTGVVLNKPSAMQLRDIWPDRTDRQGRTDTIYYGGPVEQDGLLFLFRMSPPPERALWATEDIFFSGDGALLNKLLEQPDPVPEQRFFAGYAGWAEGQLENEIAQGGWHVLRVDPDIVFDTDPGTLWQRMFQRATLPRAQAPRPNVSELGSD